MTDIKTIYLCSFMSNILNMIVPYKFNLLSICTPRYLINVTSLMGMSQCSNYGLKGSSCNCLNRNSHFVGLNSICYLRDHCSIVCS